MERIGGRLKGRESRGFSRAGTLRDMGDPAPQSAKEAARAFAGGAEVGAVTELGHGLIHGTYAAELAGGPGAGIVVQSLDTGIFRDPEALMRNVIRVTDHLRAKALGATDPARHVLRYRTTTSGDSLFRDADGGTWRASDRIADALPPRGLAGPDALREAAAAFGNFARALHDLPAPPLSETIPGFHDFPSRFQAFERAVAADEHQRGATMREEIDALHAAARSLETALPEAQVAALPRRIAHHDCKLDNLLVDRVDGRPLCVIDLDTTMPGSWLSDFGELVRSASASGAGSDADAARVDLDAFAALAAGFTGALGELLTPGEIDAFPIAGARLALMNALRFATDHLTGDVYFRTKQPGQNLARARAQRRLGEEMLSRAPALRDRLLASLPG